MRALGCAIVLGLACSLAGCANDLPKATEIVHMRVLGAKLSVVGDEARTTPRPGERVQVEMPVVFPSIDDEVSDVRSLLIGCTAPTQFTGGLPLCQEFLDAAASGDDLTSVLPMLDGFGCDDLPVPRVETPEGLSIECTEGPVRTELMAREDFSAVSLLFLGIVCEDGEPVIDPSSELLFACDGADEDAISLPLQGQVRVLRDDDPDAIENRSPDLASSTWFIDPGPWTPLDKLIEWPAWDPSEPYPPEDDCLGPARESDDDALRLVDLGDHVIRMRLDPDDAEPSVPDLDTGDEESVPETLVVTVYETAGEMERRFTVFDPEVTEPIGDPNAPDPDDDDTPLRYQEDLEWEPPDPDDVGAGGLLVRFFMAVRDERGGFDLQERLACVRPK